jgi:DNA processing protein
MTDDVQSVAGAQSLPGRQSLAASAIGSEADRFARLLLGRVGEPGDIELGHVIAEFGAPGAVEQLRAGSMKYSGLANLRARLDVAYPERDLEAGALVGARFLIPGDPEWPDQVDDLVRLGRSDGGVPLGLWVRGPLDLLSACRRSVAVVGSRASTAYGEYVAGELGIGLAERLWTVVSGGAYGIDGSAHRGALAGEGATVAVLACGVDVPYPRGHTALIDRIAHSGLIVSEWPPGCAPMRYRFLVRNRVIAALTVGTVVVEAAIRSGALSTANRARELDRHLMAVPGPVTSGMSAGTNQLLRQPDVMCVTGVADVLELVGSMGSDLAPQLMLPVDPRDELDDVSRRVLESVPVRRAAGPASIAVTAGIAPQQVLRCLGGLAARGFVERVDAGWRLRRQL